MHLPPNEAATATDRATPPAALATAANLSAPITGTRVLNVGDKERNLEAIAGAAKPVEESITSRDVKVIVSELQTKLVPDTKMNKLVHWPS